MVGNLTYFCPSLNIYTSETLIHYLSYVASIFLTGYKVEPKINQEFTYKNCVFILTCLNFSHLQSTLHLMQYTYWDIFPTAQNSFWTRWFWCFLVLLSFFILPVPHQQNVSLWGLFSSSKTKNTTRGEIRWIERVRHGGHAIFWSKTAEYSARCGQVLS